MDYLYGYTIFYAICRDILTFYLIFFPDLYTYKRLITFFNILKYLFITLWFFMFYYSHCSFFIHRCTIFESSLLCKYMKIITTFWTYICGTIFVPQIFSKKQSACIKFLSTQKKPIFRSGEHFLNTKLGCFLFISILWCGLCLIYSSCFP